MNWTPGWGVLQGGKLGITKNASACTLSIVAGNSASISGMSMFRLYSHIAPYESVSSNVRSPLNMWHTSNAHFSPALASTSVGMEAEPGEK